MKIRKRAPARLDDLLEVRTVNNGVGAVGFDVSPSWHPNTRSEPPWVVSSSTS